MGRHLRRRRGHSCAVVRLQVSLTVWRGPHPPRGQRHAFRITVHPARGKLCPGITGHWRGPGAQMIRMRAGSSCLDSP
eukprot:gene15337-biopygen15724